MTPEQKETILEKLKDINEALSHIDMYGHPNDIQTSAKLAETLAKELVEFISGQDTLQNWMKTE